MAIPRNNASGKPRLYIDVDGVLFGFYGDPVEFQLRPGVNSFLRWADEHFECWWLTSWFDRANSLMRACYFNVDFPVARWGAAKTDGIDFSGEWFWIDDDLLVEEEAELEKRGAKRRWIYVKDQDADGLEVARAILTNELLNMRQAVNA